MAPFGPPAQGNAWLHTFVNLHNRGLPGSRTGDGSAEGTVMAYIDRTSDPVGGDFYNANFAVGPNAPNKRDDVMLVQWLLHRVYMDHPSFTAPGDDLAIDG